MLRIIGRRYFAAKPAVDATKETTSHRPTKAQQMRSESEQWIEETGRAQFEAPRARAWLHPLRVKNYTLYITSYKTIYEIRYHI